MKKFILIGSILVIIFIGCFFLLQNISPQPGPKPSEPPVTPLITEVPAEIYSSSGKAAFICTLIPKTKYTINESYLTISDSAYNKGHSDSFNFEKVILENSPKPINQDITMNFHLYPDNHDSTFYATLFIGSDSELYNCIGGSFKSVTPHNNEVHLNVPHNLQGIYPACNYFAIYNILKYYREDVSLDDFLGISGYYSSFAEMNYGLGFEKYHGKFYMTGGKVLPELGYISYFSQQIQLADYSDKEAPIKEALNNRIPLLFMPNDENYWYLVAVRQRIDPIITNFEDLNVFEQPSVAHAVAITGYKQVGEDLFLEISDSAYENPDYPYYYISFANYLTFLDYVKANQGRRSNYADPLVDNTLIYKIINNQNKFKLIEPNKSFHILYKIIDSLYISASHLEGKVYDDNTAKKGASVGCDMVELMPKLADTLNSQITIKDVGLDQAKLILNEVPRILGTCDELRELSVSNKPELTKRIASANNKLYDVVELLSDLVNKSGSELKVQKDGNKITIIISPKIENIYDSDVRIGKGLLQTNINLLNIGLSSGQYEMVGNNIIKITGQVIYPLTISFNADYSEQVPLLLSVDVLPDLKSQGIYHESGYSEILAQTIKF